MPPLHHVEWRLDRLRIFARWQCQVMAPLHAASCQAIVPVWVCIRKEKRRVLEIFTPACSLCTAPQSRFRLYPAPRRGSQEGGSKGGSGAEAGRLRAEKTASWRKPFGLLELPRTE